MDRRHAPPNPQEMRELIERLSGAESPAFLHRTRQVFCNRDLRLRGVEWVGFDMDYTLARYDQSALDTLTLRLVLERLVETKGYPREVLQVEARPDFALRGLMIDRLHGNVFKMDSHRYVGKAFHGFTPLDEATRDELYHRKPVRFGERYHLIDTLFGLPEVMLYAGLVDFFERQPGGMPFSFEQLFDDTRACVDLAHRDDSIKKTVQAETARYIERDSELGATLHRLRSSGKRLFVMTNSLWPYTDHVMRHLLEGALPEYPTWRSYFDLVIVGAAKPMFFAGREPFLPLDEAGAPLDAPAPHERHERGRVYQGGNIVDLERWLGTGGPTILYVGDHIYGDILKSKKVSSWRTCMIVQEMEEELRQAGLLRDRSALRVELDQQRARLDNEIYFLSDLKRRLDDMLGADAAALPEQAELDPQTAHHLLRRRRDALRRQRRALVTQIETLQAEIERHFNPYWGLVFKENSDHSIFGKQVQDYACLYTSRVSNLGAYSPLHSFHAPADRMPHEL